MIAMLRGAVAEKHPEGVILDVGGVGYEVFIPLSTYEALPAPGENARLLIVTYLREDVLQLYGFATTDEKAAFLMLTSVTGIGMKLALASLSTLRPAELADAIARDDLTRLSRIPGVGRRLAQRLALELKEKVNALGLSAGVTAMTTGSGAPPAPPAASLREELIGALVNLGYRRPQAEQAVRQALALGAADAAEGLRLALKALSNG
ncbi:MAG: Holliday junction branch migration protein RuvA [Magnetococcales bacterium]|nr:Holliday junction branch migration protein RuvA [Magnetococcales bacterium]